MYPITLVQKEFGQIRTILTCYPCNQGYFIIQISCTYEKLINL